ncbi:MAG: hypothetical protein WCY82_11560, partial [Desulfotomaculaceae bacterium]
QQEEYDPVPVYELIIQESGVRSQESGVRIQNKRKAKAFADGKSHTYFMLAVYHLQVNHNIFTQQIGKLKYYHGIF